LVLLKYDRKAKTFYVEIRQAKVAQIEPLSDSIFFDLDDKGDGVGTDLILTKDLPEETARKISVAAAR
jgi:uncharacterized protein YuzE